MDIVALSFDQMYLPYLHIFTLAYQCRLVKDETENSQSEFVFLWGLKNSVNLCATSF